MSDPNGDAGRSRVLMLLVGLALGGEVLMVTQSAAFCLLALGVAGMSSFIWLLMEWDRKKHRAWVPDVHGENAYAILGVSQQAKLPAIRREFRRLVRKYHPDAAPPGEKERAAALFIRISQVYEPYIPR